MFERDKDNSFEKRFLRKYAKKIKLPSYNYLDAVFHPVLPDHLIILSSNLFPEGTRWEWLLPENVVEGMKSEGWYNQYKNEAKWRIAERAKE